MPIVNQNLANWFCWRRFLEIFLQIFLCKTQHPIQKPIQHSIIVQWESKTFKELYRVLTSISTTLTHLWTASGSGSWSEPPSSFSSTVTEPWSVGNWSPAEDWFRVGSASWLPGLPGKLVPPWQIWRANNCMLAPPSEALLFQLPPPPNNGHITTCA